MTDYQTLCMQLEALMDGVPYTVANLANASALLYDSLPGLNWAGFYFVQGESLVLGPFQGKPACIVIPMGRGVCGTAAAEDRTVAVPNVHEFPGHIPCDCASNSEVVIPLRLGGKVKAVLDIDSPLFDRFTEEDVKGLEEFTAILQERLLPQTLLD